MSQLPDLFPARWQPRATPTFPGPLIFLAREGERASTGPLAERSGRLLTFARSGAALGQAVSGRFYSAPSHFARYDRVDSDKSGAHDTTALRLDPAATNVINYSTDLSQVSRWVPAGTGSVTQVSRLGVVPLWGVDDTSGLNALTLTATLTAAAFPATSGSLQCLIRRGATVPATPSRIRWTDTTGAVVRGEMQWTFAGASTIPDVTYPVGEALTGLHGEFVGVDSEGIPVYLICLRATGLNAAAANTVEIAAASVVGSTGMAVVSGVQLEAGLAPTALIRTGPIQGSRVADSAYAAYEGSPKLGAMSMYVRFIERGGVWLAGQPVLQVGAAVTTWGVRANAAGTAYTAAHNNGATEVLAGQSVAPFRGDLVELVAMLDTDGSLTFSQRINGGTPTDISAGVNPLSTATSWGSARILLGPLRSYIAAGVDFGAVTLDEWAARLA